jgi:hypothetical protein
MEVIDGWFLIETKRNEEGFPGALMYYVGHVCKVRQHRLVWLMTLDNIITCNMCQTKIDHIVIKKLLLLERTACQTS